MHEGQNFVCKNVRKRFRVIIVDRALDSFLKMLERYLEKL